MTRIEIIKIEDNEYPEKLKEINNPPKLLYIEGDKSLLKTNIISIVGARVCSENGELLANKFAKELAEQKITIASGMAERN